MLRAVLAQMRKVDMETRLLSGRLEDMFLDDEGVPAAGCDLAGCVSFLRARKTLRCLSDTKDNEIATRIK